MFESRGIAKVAPPSDENGRQAKPMHQCRLRSDHAPAPPTKLGKGVGVYNRVHRRVILRDFGKPIIKASSRVALLAALSFSR